MQCLRCGKDNDDGNVYCGRCGSDLKKQKPAVEQVDPSEVKYCFKHPKVATLLSCGRCEKPICTYCVVIGPAGPRCKECAKLKIPVRPAALAADAKMGLRRLTRIGPYGFYIALISISVLFGMLRSCNRTPHYEPEDYPPTRQSTPSRGN